MINKQKYQSYYLCFWVNVISKNLWLECSLEGRPENGFIWKPSKQ